MILRTDPILIAKAGADMTHEDTDQDEVAGRKQFPTASDELIKVAKVIELVRKQLQYMEPSELRVAAALILALERFPATTPAIELTFGFAQRNAGGNYGWADISISETELRLGLGEHFYDPEIGGDTESRTVFETQVGWEWAEGDVSEWLRTAEMIASEGHVSVEDHSDHEAIKWDLETKLNAGLL